MRWVAIACVLAGGAGCRQVLGLEPGVVIGPEDAASEDAEEVVPDMTPAGHDEDVDGRPDDQDNCPATPNPEQAASTADTVGDACDPRPTDLGDRILLFLPFSPAGRPVELENTIADYQEDFVELENREIRTADQVDNVVRVSADLALVSLSLVNASFEISIGARRCRIEQCAGTACIVASNGTTSTMTPLSSVTVDGTFTLTQLPTQLECTVSRAGQLPDSTVLASDPQNDRVRLRSDKATVRVKSLTVYVADPPSP